VLSIRARRASSPGTLQVILSVTTDSRDFPCQIHSLHQWGQCWYTEPAEASGTWSFAQGTVSSATSDQKRHRVARWWAFTRRCSFRATPERTSTDRERHGSDYCAVQFGRLQIGRFCLSSGRDNLKCHELRVCFRPLHRLSLCFKKSVDDNGFELAVSASA
jgi:hypothetical protein